ncbi:hypothetical protein [Marinifilum flexuosum]|uniref:Uncharacterized protein n=1 Tax=Marinifilum flexuosum TaxID=1117708 RepID=A0A419WMY2_9BACT|nr:hypothetical protein [Marinifilum flexuosum]RKD96788.1 hypothetical protein BXY64_3735 [Marinifilum flexuosum]
MTYGKRWHIEFDTRLKGKCEVDIFQKNYTGSVELVEKYTADPLVLSAGDVSDNPFEPLQGSDILLSLVTEERLRFSEMFSADMKKHYCEVKYDGVLDGKYWFVVDLYKEPYNKPPFAVNLRAVDGIGLLKNLTFDLRGNQTIKNTIKHILDKIGFDLQIDVVNEIYEVSSGSNIHFLDTLKKFDYLDDKEDATYCDEILEQLLLSAESRMMQREGKWVIEQIPELDKVHTLRHFDSNFNPLANEQVDLSIQTTDQHQSNFCKLKVAGAQLEALPSWKQFGLTQNYYKLENSLRNGEITEKTFDQATEEEVVHTLPIFRRDPDTFEPIWENRPVSKGFKYYLHNWWLTHPGYKLEHEGVLLYELPTVDNYAVEMHHEDLVVRSSYDAFDLELEFTIGKIVYNTYTGLGTWEPTRGDVKFNVRITDDFVNPTCESYLGKDGWSATPVDILWEDIHNTELSNTFKLNIRSHSVPQDGKFIIQLWSAKWGDFPTLFFKKASIKFLNSKYEQYEDKVESVVVVDGRNNLIPTTYELDFVDLPDFPNTLNAFAGGMLLSNGWHTKLWQYNGKQDKLANLMALQYVAGFAVPRFKINANLYSDVLHRGSILSDVGSGDRKFLMGKCSYSARNSEWSGVEWLELPTYPIKGELEAMFIGSISDSVLNVFGPNAIDDGNYIIFPQLTKDVFDITNASYWHTDFQNLADFDPAQPRRWKKTWLSGPEIIEYALPEVQKYLFFKDIEGDELQTSMPIMVYSSDQTANQETIEEFLEGYFWLYDGADLLEDNGSVLIENI